jgi:hypothetical protein
MSVPIYQTRIWLMERPIILIFTATETLRLTIPVYIIQYVTLISLLQINVFPFPLGTFIWEIFAYDLRQKMTSQNILMCICSQRFMNNVYS